jgi:maleylacetoacetate isomerase
MSEGAEGLALYTYCRSSAAFRVRIALNLKGIRYEPRFVHLLRGEQRGPQFLALNPQGLVPVLVHAGRALSQSLAIIEYLEEGFPQPPLLPPSAPERARVRALAQLVACDMHPLNNRRVLDYLSERLAQAEQARLAWCRHWVAEGFGAMEKLLAEPGTGTFCHGERPTLADACLVPQVYNALRYGCDLSPYPIVRRIHGACMKLPAFQAAAPENQPDAGA